MAKQERDTRVSGTSRREALQREDARAPRGVGEDREREDDGLALTADQRDQMLRDDALQNYLPSPPPKKGVHYFWATLDTQSGASVMWYRRLGYRPVRHEEMQGWADANMRMESGEYSGCITVREMILLQCSEADYQRYMKIVHHEKPRDEANKMKDTLDAMKQDVGEHLVESAAGENEVDGFEQMDRDARRRLTPGKKFQ